MSKAKFYRDRVAAFWLFVDRRKPSECWEWQGSLFVSGYGRIKFKGRAYRAHRLSYEVHFGSIPAGLLVCHRCDNKRCVNPRHLYLGTASDNVSDTAARGRIYSGDKHWSHLKPERVLRGANHPRAKLSSEIAAEIREGFASGINRNQLAAKYGVNWSTINRVVRGEAW